MAETFTVPLIEQGMATTQVLNAPLIYIQEALNSLSASMDTISNKSAVIQWEAPVSSQVSAGMLVYFNTQTGRFEPAKAELLGQTGSQGQSIEAPSSRVQGLVLAVDGTDNSAVLLRGGYYESSVITATIGTGAEAGIYYLSPTSDGTATKTPGWNLRQPVLSYYGDGKFSIFANYLAHDNHHHGSFAVPSWIDISNYPDPAQIPSGANFYYMITSQEMLGDLSKETTAVFYNGILNTSDFQLDPLVIWYNGQEAPAADSVILFNCYPFAYGDSVIRSIKSRSVSVTNRNGNVVIQMPQYTKVPVAGSSTAVVDIQNDKMYISPVVAGLRAGAGTNIKNRGSGIYQISNEAETGVPKAATEVTLNSSQRASAGLLTYTVFPSARASSVTASLPVSFIHQDTYIADIKIWATTRGPGQGSASVSLYWIPYKDGSSTTVQIPSSPVGTGTLRFSNSSQSSLMYVQTAPIRSVTLGEAGVLVAKISMNSPTNDVYMHEVGFIVEASTSSDSNDDQSSDATEEMVMNVLDRVLKFNPNY